MAQIVADSPQVFGAKLAMGSIDEAVIYCNAVGVGDAFGAYALASALFPGMLDTGIVGAVSPPLAVAPELGVALVEAIDARDFDRALALQRAVNNLHAVSLHGLLTYGRSSFLPALREAGFDVKMYPRWPVPPLPEADAERYRQSVRDARKAVAELVLKPAKAA
jgi:dihydrodipicolinate synthase/N-acetylneuraminate lyase